MKEVMALQSGLKSNFGSDRTERVQLWLLGRRKNQP